jgi:hypothetical protein
VEVVERLECPCLAAGGGWGGVGRLEVVEKVESASVSPLLVGVRVRG